MSFKLRTHRPGDMGWIISQHGSLYTKEYNWNERVESLVARACADFIDDYNPALDRCWIAERDGEPLGCIMLAKDRTSEGTAKLRFLLVAATARAMGIASALVEECIRFARDAGYRRVVLWTHSVLTSARRLYKGAGFCLVKEEEHDTLGVKLIGEFWELVFEGNS